MRRRDRAPRTRSPGASPRPGRLILLERRLVPAVLALTAVVLSLMTAAGQRTQASSRLASADTLATPSSSAAPPAPTTAPPAPSTSATVGSEWTPVIDQSFDTPAERGQFAKRYPGWAGYDGSYDTAAPGLYDSSRVVTVTDGVLSENLHTEDGEALVVSITPVPHVQTYGRFEVRFRADVVPGYYFCWLLWPADNNWSDGEIDFPEAGLNPGDDVMGFSHQVGGDPAVNQWLEHFDGSPQAWHTAVVEWRPDSLTFTLDGQTKTTTDPRAIPSVPMYWSLQTEAGTPDATAAGSVQIDYVKSWAYTPEAAAG